MTKVNISERSGDKTLEGQHVPGSVSTSGQFQVFCKMSIETLKSDQMQILDLVNRLENTCSEMERNLQLTMSRDSEQEKLLIELKKETREQGEFMVLMKERHALSLKLVSAIGGGFISVIASLVVWLMTK